MLRAHKTDSHAPMKARVTERGVNVPPHMLEGLEEVEIREENGRVVIEPATTERDAAEDALLGLGREPVPCGAADASERHDDYLYGRN